MNRKIVTAFFLFSIFVATPVKVFSQAQTIKIEVSDADDIRSTLIKIENKPVTLILNSDKEIAGKLYNVTDKLVHITDLSGKDFYDAVVKIEDISAVVVRAR